MITQHVKHANPLLILVLTLTICLPSRADTFGTGDNSFDIEFVTIGDPGNPPDPIAAEGFEIGSVPYTYRIGKYEISRDMIEKANELGDLEITLQDLTLYGGNDPEKPATGLSWFEAARFVNWLNTFKGFNAAYKFGEGGQFELWSPSDDGYNPDNLYRNSLSQYVLPSFDEWHKAAYYDPTTSDYFLYPTGSDMPPTPVGSGIDPNTAVYQQNAFTGPAFVTEAGGLSPYGTMAQGGNASEWIETQRRLVNDSVSAFRYSRGGFWETSTPTFLSSLESSVGPPIAEGPGVRVVSVPEPTTLLLFVTFLLGSLGIGRR